MQDLTRQLTVSFIALLIVLAFGSVGYYMIGDGRWAFSDCVYMTLVIVTTLGLESLEGWESTPDSRLFTSILLIAGIGTFLYFISSFTALILENDLRGVLRKRRMQKNIDALEQHVIVCGVGRTGVHVVTELVATGTPFIAVDLDGDRLQALQNEKTGETFPFVVGDATEDDILLAAGVERAKSLVSALTEDKDNLFVVVTARGANPKLRIISRSVGARARDKLITAGANEVVSTARLGGSRLANEVLRPHVTQFLDEMLRERDKNLRIEEVSVPPRSPLVGRRLRDAGIRENTDALILAIRDQTTGRYEYNPGPDVELQSGTTLIVLLPLVTIPVLRDGIAGGFGS